MYTVCKEVLVHFYLSNISINMDKTNSWTYISDLDLFEDFSGQDETEQKT